MIEIKRASTTLKPASKIVVSSTNTGLHHEPDPQEVTTATAGVEWVGAKAYPTESPDDKTLSSSATKSSVKFMTAIRFDLFEELNRMYSDWRS